MNSIKQTPIAAQQQPTRILRWTATLLLSALPWLSINTASAADGFSCDGSLYQIRTINTTTRLDKMEIEGESGETTSFSTLGSTNNEVNGAWGIWAEGDGLAYGYVQGTIWTVDRNGNFSDLGTPTNFSSTANHNNGEVLPDGRLISKASDSDTLWVFDLSGTTPAFSGEIQLSKSVRTADLGYNPADGHLYGLNLANDRLFYIDLSTGIVTYFGVTQSNNNNHGAIWFDSYGGLMYAFDNKSGKIYQYTVGMNGSGSGSRVLLSQAPISSSNDGLSCRGGTPFPSGDISGTIYYDDSISQADRKQKLSGMTMQLYDTNGTPEDNSDDAVLRHLTTGVNGSYTFADVPVGNYRVAVTERDLKLPIAFRFAAGEESITNINVTNHANITEQNFRLVRPDGFTACYWASDRGWGSGHWELGSGGNGVTRSATFKHAVGDIVATLHEGMPTGVLWNYPEARPHQYRYLFDYGDWTIESDSILGFSNTSTNNGTIIDLDVSQFPLDQQELVIGFENMATYTVNPLRYKIVLLDAQGNSVDTSTLTLVGSEKSPNTGGNVYGIYDEEVSMDSEGVLNVNIVGANSLNTMGIFFKGIPSHVTNIRLDVQDAIMMYHDFVRMYLGTPAYCNDGSQTDNTTTTTTTDNTGTTDTSGSSAGSTDGSDGASSNSEQALAILAGTTGHSYTVAEGTTRVTALTADNASRADGLNWQISGGADAALFTIDQSGTLAFRQAPDYEAPQDSADASNNAADNQYAVTVSVEDVDSGNTSSQTLAVTVSNVASVSFSANVLLRGAYDSAEQLMRDDLRTLGYLPQQHPYAAAPFMHSSTATLDPALLTVTGEQAIVDWILVDFRQPDALHLPVLTRALLLQRDGSVVDPQSGSANLSLELAEGYYYVSVRHRNHLGVMSAQPLSFSTQQAAAADFTQGTLATRGAASRYLDDATGTYLLWAGDANQDQRIVLNGTALDQQLLLGQVMLDSANTAGVLSYQPAGYLSNDLNMDGLVTVDGSAADDTQLLLGNTTDHPGNTVFSGNAVELTGSLFGY